MILKESVKQKEKYFGIVKNSFFIVLKLSHLKDIKKDN